MVVYGYARISTDKQCIKQQEESLSKYGCKYIYGEVDSGVTGRQEKLRYILEVIGRGDVLVATRVDRLGRTVFKLVKLLNDLKMRGATLKFSEQPIDTDTINGEFMFNIMAVMADHERVLMSQRTSSALLAKIERGLPVGRPTVVTDELLEKLKRYQEKGLTNSEMCGLLGVKKTSLEKAKIVLKLRQEESAQSPTK